jgi:murein DD-endopeptidase MepM/ murein hydrolase activator NlpD
VCDPHLVDYCITEGHFVLQRPIKAPANTSVDVTYRYASTANGTRDPHHGVEFYNRFGTPVYAAADGTVVFAGPDQAATYSPWSNYYGNLVVLRNSDDLFTLYAHLSKITVKAGRNVLAGEQIGEVGQSGVAIGSHLHFEVRRGDVENYFSTQNPERWLVPNLDPTGQPFGVLQMSATNQAGDLVKRAEYTVQRFQDQNKPASEIYFGVTYAAELLKGEENAVLGDLPAGRYRIVMQYNGQHLERWVEVESGRLTQVIFTSRQ